MIRYTFYTDIVICNLVCRHEDRVINERNKICYRMECRNCQAVYFGGPKRSLKSQSSNHKRSVKSCGKGKNEIAKHCLEKHHDFHSVIRKIVDREMKLISRKFKETIKLLKNASHAIKISFVLSEVYGCFIT